MKYSPICDGDIIENSNGALACSGDWFSQPAYVPFDIGQIDPEIATLLFTGGLFLVFTPWITALGFSYILKMIK
jgi:hypothetical protein